MLDTLPLCRDAKRCKDSLKREETVNVSAIIVFRLNESEVGYVQGAEWKTTPLGSPSTV